MARVSDRATVGAAEPARNNVSQKPKGFPTRPAPLKPIKKIYIVTDMEGVAGVRDFENWCEPAGRYYDLGRKLLTLEVNAAVEGFSRAARGDTVLDGHGYGGVAIELLDSRAKLERGWPSGYPGASLAGGGFDAIAWVGQHAKAEPTRTPTWRTPNRAATWTFPSTGCRSANWVTRSAPANWAFARYWPSAKRPWPRRPRADTGHRDRGRQARHHARTAAMN